MIRETVTAYGGKKLSVAIWENVKKPKAVVQLAHGMAEHIARYDDFARFLNANGFIAFGNDHRAHGETDADALGIAGGDDIFSDTVSDLIELTEWAEVRWGLPIIFFGHSYGSFLGQAYLLEASNKLAACVLSGSALYGSGLASFGEFVSNRKFKKHASEPGKFFAKLTFESYDKKTGAGLNGWLSRDTESNKAYNEDDKCGYKCSYGFYKWFFHGMKMLAKKPFTPVRRDLPLLVIYGKKDYVGSCGKLVDKLVKKYESAGLRPKVIGYESARHEVLNEINKAEVYSDVLEFLDLVV